MADSKFLQEQKQFMGVLTHMLGTWTDSYSKDSQSAAAAHSHFREHAPTLPGPDERNGDARRDQQGTVQLCLRTLMAQQRTSLTHAWFLVELSVGLAQEDRVFRGTTTLQLLTDLVEYQTLATVEHILPWVPALMDKLRRAQCWDKHTPLKLLKMANFLLRRLSKTSNTELCGRMQFLLAQVLPLDDRSGMNVVGAINKGNTTEFEGHDEEDEKDEEDQEEDEDGAGQEDDEIKEENDADEKQEKDAAGGAQEEKQGGDDGQAAMEVVEEEEEAAAMTSDKDQKQTKKQKKKKTAEHAQEDATVDYNLYTRLWKLQSFFSDPERLVKVERGAHKFQEEEWAVLTDCLEHVLRAFENTKLSVERQVVPAGAAVDGHKSSAAGRTISASPVPAGSPEPPAASPTPEEPERESAGELFPKYLTGARLLDLQLVDLRFRRYLLVQCLILFEYLKFHQYMPPAPQQKEDTKVDAANDRRAAPVVAAKPKVVKFKHSVQLPETHHGVVDGFAKRASKLLERTPHGRSFVHHMRSMFERERHWVRWKNADPWPAAKRVGCPPLETAPTTLDGSLPDPLFKKHERGKSASDLLGFATGIRGVDSQGNRVVMGSTELQRLWTETQTTAEALADETRQRYQPSMEELEEDLKEEEQMFADADEEEKMDMKKNDPRHKWRILRVLGQGERGLKTFMECGKSLEVLVQEKKTADTEHQVTAAAAASTDANSGGTKRALADAAPLAGEKSAPTAASAGGTQTKKRKLVDTALEAKNEQGGAKEEVEASSEANGNGDAP